MIEYPKDDMFSPPADTTELPQPPPCEQAAPASVPLDVDAEIASYEAHIGFLTDTPEDDTETEFLPVAELRHSAPPKKQT